MTQQSTSRRRILGAAIAGAAVTAMPALRAQSPKPWRLGHQFVADHPVAIGALEAAKVLAQKSGGHLCASMCFLRGQLGTGKELVQHVSYDRLDMTIDGLGQFGLWQKPLTIFEIGDAAQRKPRALRCDCGDESHDWPDKPAFRLCAVRRGQSGRHPLPRPRLGHLAFCASAALRVLDLHVLDLDHHGTAQHAAGGIAM